MEGLGVDPAGPVNDGEVLRRQLIESYVAARDYLDGAIADLQPETACGGWTVIEIAAHIAAWEHYSAEWMSSSSLGEPEPPVDVDEMNALAAATARSAPAAQSLGAYVASRQLFVDCLKGLPPGALVISQVRDHVAMETEHCFEHGRELRALKGA